MNIKNYIHELTLAYGDKERDLPVFYRKEWENSFDLSGFNVTPVDVEDDVVLHDFDKFDEEEFWNGMIKNPMQFNLENKNISFAYSDYYTLKTLKETMNDKIRNYPRELASIGNIGVCISIGVIATLVSEENPDKFLRVTRSNDVGLYPGFHGVAPAGGVDDDHDTLLKCAEEELDEEVNLNPEDVDFYYTGAMIDLYTLGFNISALGVVRGKTLEEVKEESLEARDDFEFSEVKVEDFSKVGLKYDKYNTTPPGLYSMQRAKEEAEDIVKN